MRLYTEQQGSPQRKTKRITQFICQVRVLLGWQLPVNASSKCVKMWEKTHSVLVFHAFWGLLTELTAKSLIKVQIRRGAKDLLKTEEAVEQVYNYNLKPLRCNVALVLKVSVKSAACISLWPQLKWGQLIATLMFMEGQIMRKLLVMQQIFFFFLGLKNIILNFRFCIWLDAFWILE